MGKHVVLVEPGYHTHFPPLGLLKLSAYHKMGGDTTELMSFRQGPKLPRARPDLVYVTSLYTWEWKLVWNAVRYLKMWFSGVPVWLGGLYASIKPEHARLSGADYVHEGLFKEAEDLLPDYDLVPEWNGSILFSSRGCPNQCGFCAVPRLEGKMSFAKHSIRHLIWPGHEKKEGCCKRRHHTRIIFFDNNILASPGWSSISDELLELGLQVDFNQGLDARLISEDVAEKISKMKKRDGVVRLAYDYPQMKPYVERAIERLGARAGIDKRHILVYTLFNYVDDPEEFFHRVKEILRWGVACYPMRYIPIDATEKKGYVAPKWTLKEIEFVEESRRIIGYGGAFPPYKALIDKFDNSSSFNDAFDQSLYQGKRRRSK